MHDADIGRDDILASGINSGKGSYNTQWTSIKTDRWGDTAEIYAKFEGDDIYKPSESNEYTITL